jgi:hypothetical protein
MVKDEKLAQEQDYDDDYFMEDEWGDEEYSNHTPSALITDSVIGGLFAAAILASALAVAVMATLFTIKGIKKIATIIKA